MNRYARQEIIEGWDQTLVQEAKILVVGAGTIGNEIIKNLVLLGAGHIVAVDNDIVAEVNLNRSVLFRTEDIGKPKAEVAVKRAKELNSDVHIEGWNCNAIYDIGCMVYGKFDCIFLAVDNLEARININRYAFLTQTPLIDTGIGGLDGNVFVSIPPHSSCLECGFLQKQYNRLSEKYSCLRVGLDWSEPQIPMVITSAAVISGIATQEFIKVLKIRKYGAKDNVSGLFHKYYGELGCFEQWKLSKNPNCRNSHCSSQISSLNDRRIIDIEISPAQQLESIFDNLKQILGTAMVEIWHDKELVYSQLCRDCGYTTPTRPVPLGEFRRQLCPKCNKLTIVPDEIQTSAQLKAGFKIEDFRIPSNHLLEVKYLSSDNDVETAWIIS